MKARREQAENEQEDRRRCQVEAEDSASREEDRRRQAEESHLDTGRNQCDSLQ